MYIVFGILTTVVNCSVFLLCYNTLFRGKDGLYANIITFIAAVLFAFVVNKLFVFESKSWSFMVLKKEIPSFLATRIGLFYAEKILRLNRFEVLRIWDTVIDGIVIAKLALAIVVVLLNYVFYKFFVFKSTTIK